MNIKSLLLGSAAILVAATTAQAADAIVVEPEPVEYVRVCDTYGSGFFYLPGTETCMRISGYIRSTYDHYKENQGGVEGEDHASWTYRGRLNIDVRNETDWGTLRSQLRLQGGDAGASGDANVGVDRALISVAGFRVGYSDTFWTTTGHYGQGPAINDGFFNYDQALFVDYTYAADGFSLTGGFQDTSGTVRDSETPDYYVGVGYAGSWGWFSATYIYDQSAVDVVSGNVGGDAWKVAAELQNIGDSGWNFGGWYQADGDSGTSYVTAGFLGASANSALVESEWGIQANGKLTDNLVGYALYTAADAVSSSTTYNDTKGYSVGLVWTPISGLSVQGEYYSYESDYVLDADDYEKDGFIVRITRSW
ncbi:MAG: porin [Rhizobiaceae bacterium]|nr:porin [Rhizobiaceae bacterium]